MEARARAVEGREVHATRAFVGGSCPLASSEFLAGVETDELSFTDECKEGRRRS